MNIIIKDKEAMRKLLQPIYGQIYSITAERDHKIKEETGEFLKMMREEFEIANKHYSEKGEAEVTEQKLTAYNDKKIEEKTERIMSEYKGRIDKRVVLIESLKYAIDYEFVDSISLTSDDLTIIDGDDK